jgi:hypothetical protein
LSIEGNQSVEELLVMAGILIPHHTDHDNRCSNESGGLPITPKESGG